MNISFNAIQNVILIFPDERPVFLREVNNNMYRTSPYFWAKVISELPFSIMTPVIFGCIVYYAIGFNPDFGTFIVFLVILVLIYNASSGYSLIISASFSDKQLAVTLTPVLSFRSCSSPGSLYPRITSIGTLRSLSTSPSLSTATSPSCTTSSMSTTNRCWVKSLQKIVITNAGAIRLVIPSHRFL